EVMALDPSADDALATVTRQTSELAEMDVEPAKRSTTGVTVHEERDDADGAHVHRGYRARSVVTVRLSAPSRAGRLIQGAVGRVNANVHGPLWWIAPDDPARVEACAGAAVEARRKAEAYAQALGLSLGRIIEVR